MLLCLLLTINLDHLLWSKVETTMPECVVPRNEGEPNLTEQVHCKLLKDYFNTGKAVDHSIMAPHQSWASNKRIKLQGYRTSAKGKYKILAEFYYDAMQKVTDKCDEPPCQHLFDFTCNLICVINAQILCSCIFLPA